MVQHVASTWIRQCLSSRLRRWQCPGWSAIDGPGFRSWFSRFHGEEQTSKTIASEAEDEGKKEAKDEDENHRCPDEGRPVDHGAEDVGDDGPELGHRPEDDVRYGLDDGVQRADLPHALHVHGLVVGLAGGRLKCVIALR